MKGIMSQGGFFYLFYKFLNKMNIEGMLRMNPFQMYSMHFFLFHLYIPNEMTFLLSALSMVSPNRAMVQQL